jgi:phospholipid/cholesterol/gamma-HCH transport system ATP-binding protein
MPTTRPVLELAQLRLPTTVSGELHSYRIDFTLMPGDAALVDVRRMHRGAWFADLCCGLVPVAEGAVRFLGHDWSQIPDYYAAALRGYIGRIFADGGWIEFLDVATNILLPQLHHTHEDEPVLRERATQLACTFGLPGLPLGHAEDLSALDLARSACVRAFLGKPALLLLESPVQGRAFFAELLTPLLDAITTARSEGAAVMWFTQSDMIWNDRSFPVSHRLHLHDHGLVPARREHNAPAL